MKTTHLSLLAAIFLGGCSLLFQPIESEGADAGDSSSLATDGGGAVAGDAQQRDAMPVPADAALCNPFSDPDCYVNNWPLGGPFPQSTGAGTDGSDCTLSSDCAAVMFCTGVGGTSGYCLPLCDDTHACDEGRACLSTDWQSYGFCELKF